MNDENKELEFENGLSTIPYTVVKIEGEARKHPGTISSGTGFFYQLDTAHGSITMIATNKHVVDGQDFCAFICHSQMAIGKGSLGPRN